MRKSLLMLLTALCVVNAWAQREADKTIQFDQRIETILLNPYTGSLIVKENKAIQSYDSKTDKVEWRLTQSDLQEQSLAGQAMVAVNDLNLIGSGDLSQLIDGKNERVEFIDNSPYISLTLNGSDVIINAMDGKVVYNGTGASYKLLEQQYLPSEEALLLMVLDKKMYSCIYFDLKSGKQMWVTELATTESVMKSIGKLLLLKSEAASENKVVISADNIYTLINTELYKLSKSDGKLQWKSDFKMTDFYLSQNNKNIIAIQSIGGLLSSKKALNILNIDNANKLWKDDIVTKYFSYIEDWSDRILVAHAKGFNFYSYADGKKIWKKDAKGSEIKQVITIGQDYLYVADREMNLIDKDGKNKWKKFIEIADNDEDVVYYLGQVENNRVFYLTDTYGNMVDYTSGKKIWKKNIEFDKKRPLLYGYDKAKNVFMVYNDKRLYKFDPNSAEKPEAFAKLKEVKNDKLMSGIELFDWGISLVGEADVLGVTFDGQTKYHNTYKEPGSAQRQILKGGAIATSSFFGIRGGIKSAIANMEVGYRNEKGEVVYQKMLTEESSAALMESAQKDKNISDGIDKNVYSRVKGRFQALQHNREHAFVINRVDNEAQLVKVRKEDGVEIDKIMLDSNKPIYEIDPVDDIIYYVSNSKLLIFNKK